MRHKSDRVALAILATVLGLGYLIYKPVLLVKTDSHTANTEKSVSNNLNQSISNIKHSMLNLEHSSSTNQRSPEGPSEHNAKNCGSLTITVMGNMGIGNMLFQYATVYGLAKMLNRKPTIHTNPALFRPKAVFSNISIPIIEKLPPYLTRISDGKCCVASNALLSIPCNSADIELCCYTQSWKYFESAFEDLKRELTFKDQLENTCIAALNEERKKTRVENDKLWLVGVHFRNYASEGDAFRYGHPLPNMTFVKRAIEEFRKNSKDAGKVPRFLLIGRELDWLKEHFSNKTEYADTQISPKRSWEIDFCLLTKVDHLIFTTGTFAWWGAFFNKGIVMRQAEHCVPGSQFCSEFNENAADHYLNDRWLYF